MPARGRIAPALACALLLAGAGCSGPDLATTTPASAISPGPGSFEVDGLDLLDGAPLRVEYLAPDGDLGDADVLVVMPGVLRNAGDYRDDWRRVVAARPVLVLVPQFDEDRFPLERYHLGNLQDADEEPVPESEWTFTLVSSLVREVMARVGTRDRHYDMFGHSAGAQFVHRFVEFSPDPLLRTAVAANAGWYTDPDDSVEFPYGLDGIPLDQDELGPSFATDLVILLGGEDIDPEDDLLRTDEAASEQGSNRLERGLHFFERARAVAAQEDLPFAWGLQVAPGIGHDHTEMAAVAARILYR